MTHSAMSDQQVETVDGRDPGGAVETPDMAVDLAVWRDALAVVTALGPVIHLFFDRATRRSKLKVFGASNASFPKSA